MAMRMTLANLGRVRIRRRAAMCEGMECLRANGHKPIGEQNAQDDKVPDQSAHQETVAARISSPSRRFFRRFLRSSSCFEKYCAKLIPSTVASSGDSLAWSNQNDPSLPTPAPAFNSPAVTARSEPRPHPSLAARLRLSRVHGNAAHRHCVCSPHVRSVSRGLTLAP